MRSSIAVLFACGACGSVEAGGGAATPSPPPPVTDAAPMMDASNAPVDDSQPAMGWWKQGVAACPKGGRLDGGPPPGTHAACQRADYIPEGPEAWWDDQGHLISIGANKDGRRNGKFTAFFPDGKKQREGSYLHGNQHGVWTTWRHDGSVLLKERFVDGRGDGEQVAYAPDGKVIEKWTLKLGTGSMKTWGDDGHKGSETDYVDGRPHGDSTSYFASGKVEAKMHFVDGDPDGAVTYWFENGKVQQQGTYRHGTTVGDWSMFDEHGAQTSLVRHNWTGDEVFELLYDGGKPLVPVPAASACDDTAALRKVAFGAAKGEHECLDRIRSFPGLAVTGSFAYDAGCRDAQWIVDCKKARRPDDKAILARGGWAKAKGKLREQLAQAYVHEVALLWNGGTTDQPDPEKAVAAADGSVVVTAWTMPSAGMRPDPTITLMEWRFAADGSVTAKAVKTGKRSP